MKGPILVCKLCRRWRIDQVTEEFLLGGEHGGAPLPAQRSVDSFRAGTRPYADLECTARCNYVVLPEAVHHGQVVCVTLSTVGDALVVGEEVPPEHAHSATPMIDTITGNDFSFGTFLVLRFRRPRKYLQHLFAILAQLRISDAGHP